MEAWMAFVSIIAIVAIVVVAGGIIAFIAHVIIGAFDKDNIELQNKKNEVLDYSQYKQLQDVKTVEVQESKEYDFDAINKAKVEQERKLAEQEAAPEFEIEKDSDLEDIENRLKEENKTAEIVEEVKVEDADEDDLSDLDDLLAEISSDVIEEEKEVKAEEDAPKMSDALAAYSIDKILEESDTDEEAVEEAETEVDEETEESEEVVETEEIEEEATEEIETEEIEEEATEVVEETTEEDETEDEIVEEVAVEETVNSKELDSANAQIEELKAQLAALNKQLEQAQSSKVEVVTISMTEAECLNRLEVLEERLKNVRKDYKINLKEYKPLKKVMTDLERYQTKLRRKETIVAKKKVALYGVNNYVDIDKEKAEKLANELELYEGLRLSVAHCEEVINANKDRFPILEHTNQILEDQIAHIEADIESTKLTLQKIREQNGESGENENPENE